MDHLIEAGESSGREGGGGGGGKKGGERGGYFVKFGCFQEVGLDEERGRF